MFVSFPTRDGEAAKVLVEASPGTYVDIGGASSRTADSDAEVLPNGTLRLR